MDEPSPSNRSGLETCGRAALEQLQAAVSLQP